MKILILGAGLMQKPAILSAKEEGYKVIVVDADEKAMATSYADEFYKIDLKDKERIFQLAKEIKDKGELAGVFTAGTDFSSSVSYVCEKLALPSHSYEAAMNASIKTKMRECFEREKVPSPAFLKIVGNDLSSDYKEKIEKKFNGNYPLVVKPVDNMGARGCRMVREASELKSSLESAIECSRSASAIVEEYMEGPEYSIDALIYNGTMTITGFAERHIKYPPYFIEIGHTMPVLLDKKIHDELISVFALGAKALGLTCGAAKADIKYTKKGPMIGEIAGRLSGGYMSGWTYPYASDLNLTKEGIFIACGREPLNLLKKRQTVDFLYEDKFEKPYEIYEVPCVRTSVERAWLSIPGEIEYIENISDFTDKGIFDFLPRATAVIGSKVNFPRNNVEKCGNIIGVSHSKDMIVAAVEDAISNVFITLKANNLETQKFLDNQFKEDESAFPPSAFEEIPSHVLEKISGIIPADEKVQDNIPEVLRDEKYLNLKDWSFNTITQIAQKFDILRVKHPELDAKVFWSAIVRGGLQAAVYISDSKI